MESSTNETSRPTDRKISSLHCDFLLANPLLLYTLVPVRVASRNYCFSYIRSKMAEPRHHHRLPTDDLDIAYQRYCPRVYTFFSSHFFAYFAGRANGTSVRPIQLAKKFSLSTTSTSTIKITKECWKIFLAKLYLHIKVACFVELLR